MTLPLLSFAVGFAAAVEFQSLAGLALEIGIVDPEVEGLRLPLDGRLKIAAFGTSRGQGIEVGGLFPIGQLASLVGRYDCLFRVAVAFVGRSSTAPRAVVLIVLLPHHTPL